MKFLLLTVFIFNVVHKSQTTCPASLPQPPAPTFTFNCTSPPSSCNSFLQYRTYDGTCNNLQTPMLGAANYLYRRFATPSYGDGLSSFPKMLSGKPLPNARNLSTQLFGTAEVKDPNHSLGVAAFGQFVAHDLGNRITKAKVTCCDAKGQYVLCDDAQVQCATIDVISDPVFPPNMTCLNFVRSVTDHDIACETYVGRILTPAEQVNSVTSYADLSTIYGTSKTKISQIRSFTDGKLLVDTRYQIDWPKQDTSGTTCAIAGESCFLFGDSRANQNAGLTLVELYYFQEHNRLATGLKQINPSWTDEKLFQEARRINIAQYQRVLYYEFLPILVPTTDLIYNQVIYPAETGYIGDYQNANAGTLNEFSTGAYRFFHTLESGYLDLIAANFSVTNTLRLSDWLQRPRILDDNEAANYELLGRGLAQQKMEMSDINFDPEVRDFLFRRTQTFGQDIRSTDFTRARDHGLGTYNDVREKCGMRRLTTWKLFETVIPLASIKKLKIFYETPDDVEFVVAGALETPKLNSLVGPTFTCIITEQFYRTRIGDRFFYENGETSGYPFTLDQLSEIRKATVARIYCDHVKNIQQIQKNAFNQVSLTNPLVSCSSIPSLDLTKWKA